MPTKTATDSESSDIRGRENKEPNEWRAAIGGRLRSISEEGIHRRADSEKIARKWGKRNYLVGIPAALFAGGAGAVTALTDLSNAWKITAVLLAFLASGLSGIATALNASKREEIARGAAIGYDALARKRLR